MSPEDFNKFLSNHKTTLVYYSHENCSVCKQLKPKIILMLQDDFPEIGFLYFDVKKYPEVPAQNLILTVPTVVLYTMGKEYKRFVRVFGIQELKAAIEKAEQLQL